MTRDQGRTAHTGAKAALAALLLVSSTALAQRAPLPAELIGLDAPEGQRLLLEAEARDDYFRLSNQFITQKTQSYCGVASSVMVLNALPIPAPTTDEWAPFHAYTQDNVFTANARQIVTPEKVGRGGMTLDQLAAFLQTQPVQARAFHAGELTLDQFREQAVKNLADPSDFIIVNWLRSAVGQEPRGLVEGQVAGHFSPLAAYHRGTDRFLVLDVARYKYPPAWIEARKLFDAMNTQDVDSGTTRGFVVVRPGAGVAPGAVRAGSSRVTVLFFGLLAVVFLLGAATGAWLRGRRLRTSR